MPRGAVSIALVSLFALPVLHAQPPMPTPASRASDNFESGTLANWRIETSGAGGWYVYSDGSKPPEGAKSDPFWPFEAPAPPQGRFAAISDTDGSGTRILYRDVALDGRYRLSVTVYFSNGGRFSDPDPGRTSLGDSQEFRIDVMSPAAPLTSLAREHILATIFRGLPIDNERQPPTELSRDLSPFAGQTIRLRIVSSDNQGPVRAAVDDIRFERLN